MGLRVTAREEDRIICQQAKDQQWGPRSLHVGFGGPQGAGCHPRPGRGREAEPYPEHGQTVAFDDRSELEHLAQSCRGVPQGPGGSAGVCGWRQRL